MKNILSLLLCLCSIIVFAQEEKKSGVAVHGALQHDGIFGVNAEDINAKYDDPYLSNSYLDLGLQSEHVNAGIRLELMNKPLQGFPDRFPGAGISNIYVQGKYKWLDITVGDVYAQYGSGLILRLYEERSLGIDNSLRGGKLVLKPYKGIHLEAIGGKQRVYWNCYEKAWGWNYKDGAVIGGNAELQIDEWSQTLTEKGARLLFGASYVSRYEPADTMIDYNVNPSQPQLCNVPEWVAATDFRVKFQMKDWSALAEYAYKVNDPSVENDLSYNHGEALLLSLSYSKRGMSFLVQAKRSENMSFRSSRSLRDKDGMLNYLPAFSTTHTYALATIYPYATQTAGEWAWQAEMRYSWKKNTAMGGKYGTTLHLNGTHIRGIKPDKGWFGVGKETYYTDVHLDLSKRLSKKWWLNAMYLYQACNLQVTRGEGELIHSHIIVADAKVKINDKVAMRMEAQYMYSNPKDESDPAGDYNQHWVHGLCELSLWNCLTLTASDTYNVNGKNYWQAGATFQMKGHRLQAAFVRQKAGYNCTGGVCRYVPAGNGATLNYSYNF